MEDIQSLKEKLNRFKELHGSLDILTSDFLTATSSIPSEATILDLMTWSFRRMEDMKHHLQDERLLQYNDEIHLDQSKKTRGAATHVVSGGPMCCGTPLENGRCKVCGEDYRENDEKI